MSAPNHKSATLFAFVLVLLLLASSCKKDPVKPITIGPPSKLTAINGLYYKGQMKSLVQTPLLLLKATDSKDNPVANTWIHLRLLDGDGALFTAPGDSTRTDSSGNTTVTYDFNARLGHARLRALLPGKDSVDVALRANTIIIGSHSQAQYILTGDTYATVKNFNGPPLAIDVDPNFYLNYIVYESTLGLVLIVEDKNKNSAVDDTERVIGLIVNNAGANGEYKGKTAEGIGLGSKYSEIRAAYGPADSVWLDPIPPEAIVLSYLAGALYLYCTTTDTTAFEMHLVPPVAPPAVTRPPQPRDTHSLANSSVFHRFRK